MFIYILKLPNPIFNSGSTPVQQMYEWNKHA